MAGVTSIFLAAIKSLPQGSALGGILFSTYIIDLSELVQWLISSTYTVDFNLLLLTLDSAAFESLQFTFDAVLENMKLFLNVEKVQSNVSTNGCVVSETPLSLKVHQGKPLEVVTRYNCLGWVINGELLFTMDIQNRLVELVLSIFKM